jgi:hypothetical protein
MMVSTVLVLGLWRSMAKTLGRICQQIFITAADIQEMAGSNWEGEVSRVILSLLNLQTSCCVFTLKILLCLRRHRQEEHLEIP